LGDHLGDLRKGARLVDRLHGKLRRKSLRHLVVDIPTHVEPALRLILELFERLRLYRIDRDSLAGSENADDPVARNGAALGGTAAPRARTDSARRDSATLALARDRSP